MIGSVEKSNYLIRKLMNGVFWWDEIDKIKSYTGMDALRWARRLDKTTDIDLFPQIGPQPEYNLDIDLLEANLDWK